MAGSVAAERHLWLNLTEIREKEKVFLLDAQSGLFGEAVRSVVEKFRSAKTQSAALKQFMPRRTREHSTPSSSLSREQSLPRKEPSGGSGAQAAHPSPTTVWGARGRSFPRQRPHRRVDLKRPNRPAASAPPSRSWPSSRNKESHFTATRRDQTAKVYLSASNALSSLKSVTTIPRGLVCRTSSPSFFLSLAVGGHVRLSPSTVHPLAASGPRVRGHSRFSPAAYGPRAGHLSVQHFTLHQPKQGRQGLSFVVEAVTASRPSRHPISGMSSFAWHSASSIAFHSRMGASTGGIALGSPHNLVRLHISVWEKSPPLRRGSADSSKQRLQGFCSKTRTFLPPAERSDRGNTSVGHRTRVLQPLLPCSKERRRPGAHFGSAASEFFPLQREVKDADDENHHVSDSRRGLVCHYRPKGCIFSHPGRSATQEVPSVCLWREGLPIQPALRPGFGATKCMDAALAPLRLQGIRVLNYLDDWLILAHSRELVSRHRDIVLRHIHSLGLRMNAKKSVLLPSQRTVFLGVHLDSIQMQACLAPARISKFTACLARFRLGRHVSVGTCCRLLGLMAAASPVLPLRLLHMRPLLWWMKELRLHPTIPALCLIRVSAQLLSTPFTMAGPCFSPERGENGCDPPSPYDHDGRINDELGRGLRRQTGERGMDRRVPFLAHKLCQERHPWPNVSLYAFPPIKLIPAVLCRVSFS